MAPAGDWPLPRWIAHRGAGKLAPENTLAAFRLGAAHGYRAFECDVKLSADDVPYLLHDATLERTTSGHGRVDAMTWSELSRLDAGGWHSRAYAGEPMPTLDAVAAYLIRNGYRLDLEIKPVPGTEERTGRLVAEHVSRLWAGEACKPLLTSFQPAALRGAQQACPGLARGLLLDAMHPGWLDMARSLQCAAVVTHYALMSPELIAQLHDEGWRAMVYTVNDPPEAQRLLRLGIDGIVTDAVDRLSPADDAELHD